MLKSILWLILFIELAIYLVAGQLFDLRVYTFLFVLESVICVYFFKHNKSIFQLLFLDIFLFTILNTVIPFLIEWKFLSVEIRTSIYHFSVLYYDFVLIFRAFIVHLVALSYLTFGKPPRIKAIYFGSVIVFVLYKMLSPWVGLDDVMIASAFLGIGNFVFYQIYKLKRNMGLPLKKELLFFLYFIGFGLSALEHFNLYGNSYFVLSTSYNYVVFLILSLCVLLFDEAKLYTLIYHQWIKLGFIALACTSVFIDEFREYYIPQSLFLVTVLLYAVLFTRNLKQRYTLRKT